MYLGIWNWVDYMGARSRRIANLLRESDNQRIMEAARTTEPTHITATELARNLSDILNRVRYQGERFVVTRAGDVIAVLEPQKEGPKKLTVAEFRRKFAGVRVPEGFADALEQIRSEVPPVPPPPAWPSS